MFVTFFYCDVFVSVPLLESPIIVVGHFKNILFVKKLASKGKNMLAF
jgi:hypothetical protein